MRLILPLRLSTAVMLAGLTAPGSATDPEIGVQQDLETIKKQWCQASVDRSDGPHTIQSAGVGGWDYLDADLPIPRGYGFKTLCGSAEATDGYHQTMQDLALGIEMTYWLPCQKQAAPTDPHLCCVNQAVVMVFDGYPDKPSALAAIHCKLQTLADTKPT